MESLTDRLKIAFPRREQQIEHLYRLFGHEEPFPECIYIYGPSSTGKSAILFALLDELEIKSARINLVECYSSKVLFESIINQLSGHKMDPLRGLPYAKCENMMEFLHHLPECTKEAKAVVVLDKAEYLRNMDCNLLPGFLRLRELSGLPLTVIFISEIVFENYYIRSGVVEPIKLHFPQYTKDELLEILALDFDRVRNNFGEDLKISREFFINYLGLFLSVFYRDCRDLSELRHMAKLNFAKYCEPVIKKECKAEDSMALWRHIAPILKASLEVLYLRISATNQRETKCEGMQTSTHFAFSRENLAQSLELPYYAKYLLIAAYLASYNPAKDDKRLFMKHHGKKTRRKADIKAKQKVSEKLNTQVGPKAFGFDRLIAIFYAILEEKVDFNSNLLVQISTLVELQLLSIVTDNCDLDSRKYKCCVGFEFIQVVAKTVEFDIVKYLVDFS